MTSADVCFGVWLAALLSGAAFAYVAVQADRVAPFLLAAIPAALLFGLALACCRPAEPAARAIASRLPTTTTEVPQ